MEAGRLIPARQGNPLTSTSGRPCRKIHCRKTGHASSPQNACATAQRQSQPEHTKHGRRASRPHHPVRLRTFLQCSVQLLVRSMSLPAPAASPSAPDPQIRSNWAPDIAPQAFGHFQRVAHLFGDCPQHQHCCLTSAFSPSITRVTPAGRRDRDRRRVENIVAGYIHAAWPRWTSSNASGPGGTTGPASGFDVCSEQVAFDLVGQGIAGS